ncbi:MAG: hypothetical protein M3071_05240 [Actinomycetota bacterium]|nr:hypothetical protein [Actinomycetota bacterium]
MAGALVLDFAEDELQKLPERLGFLLAFGAGDVVVTTTEREQQVVGSGWLEIAPAGSLRIQLHFGLGQGHR